MKLFNEKNNRFFEIARNITNKAVNDGGIAQKEIDRLTTENGFTDYNYEFCQAIAGKKSYVFEDICLLGENGENYFPLIDSTVPARFTRIEIEWLASVLQDENVDAFLSESTLSKLQNNFEGIQPLFKEGEINNKSLTPQIKTNISFIVKAIDDGKGVICSNTSLRGDVYKDSLVVPYRIEYSAKMSAFWLIGFLPIEDKMVKMAVERMSVQRLTKDPLTINFEKYTQTQRKDTPIVLEIKDEKGALERALHSLSGYKKNGIYDKEQGVHRIRIYYYEFDEYELIQNIISLGAYVKVVGPQSVKAQILGRVRTQQRLFA